MPIASRQGLIGAGAAVGQKEHPWLKTLNQIARKGVLRSRARSDDCLENRSCAAFSQHNQASLRQGRRLLIHAQPGPAQEVRVEWGVLEVQAGAVHRHQPLSSEPPTRGTRRPERSGDPGEQGLQRLLPAETPS